MMQKANEYDDSRFVGRFFRSLDSGSDYSYLMGIGIAFLLFFVEPGVTLLGLASLLNIDLAEAVDGTRSIAAVVTTMLVLLIKPPMNYFFMRGLEAYSRKQ